MEDSKASLNLLSDLIGDSQDLQGGNYDFFEEAFENDLDFINDKVTTQENTKTEDVIEEENEEEDTGLLTKAFAKKKVSFDLPPLEEEYGSDFDSDKSEDENGNEDWEGLRSDVDSNLNEANSIKQEETEEEKDETESPCLSVSVTDNDKSAAAKTQSCNVSNLEGEGVGEITQPECSLPAANSRICKARKSDKQNISNGKPTVSSCKDCNCRLAPVNIFEIPRLNNLFSRGSKTKSSKHDGNIRKAGNDSRTKDFKQQKSFGSKKVAPTSSLRAECGDFMNSPSKKHSKVTKDRKNSHDSLSKEHIKQNKTVDQFWTPSNDSALLKWLKNKNKEIKQKRRMEKSQRKEELKARKLANLEDSCRKEFSQQKVEEWMINKKKAELAKRKSVGSRVQPVDCSRLGHKNKDVPDGYLVLESFKQKPEGQKDKSKDDICSSSTNKKPQQKMRNKTSKKRPSTPDKKEQESLLADKSKETRKSYDEWLKEKLAMSKEKKIQNAKKDVDSNFEQKIAADERKRRYKARQDLKIKVDSKWEKKKVDNKMKNINERTKTFSHSVGNEGKPEPQPGLLEIGARPEPQGCDHTVKTADSEEISSGNQPVVGNTDIKERKDGVSHAKSAFEYLSEDNHRAWMEGVKKNNQKLASGKEHTQTPSKPQRPKTARPKTLVNNLVGP